MISSSPSSPECTNALVAVNPKTAHKSLFEQALIDRGIFYKRIRIATPRHNGKAERMPGCMAEQQSHALRPGTEQTRCAFTVI